MLNAAVLAIALVPGKGALAADPLIDDLQHRAVTFFWEQSDPTTGFTKDRAANDAAKPAPNEIASSASVGFALVAYSIGVERKWLDRKDALARTRTTLRHLVSDWPHEHGWLYHFVDWKTGARQWNCEASTIDTSICLAGVIAAERYWKDPEITRDAQAFIRRIDWKWALTDNGAKPDESHFSMGWTPEKGFIVSRWENFDECKMLYVQAYGLSDVRTDGWDKIKRQPVVYKGFDMITGGPLFMHQMSEAFYNFRGMRDRQGYSYEIESRNAALGNRQYCIDNPKGFKGYGPDLWGLSACDFPGGYNAFGAPGWIQDDGTITPTSAVASIQFIPKEAMSFAEAMRRDHPEAWGRYGFPNGYNPNQKWVGPDVIGIDLGMMLLAIENHRTGLPMKLSAANPLIGKGMQRAGLRKASDANEEPLRRL
ncbi:glucoamylase family protein [soil metagenome]